MNIKNKIKSINKSNLLSLFINFYEIYMKHIYISL